jgi:hypothetical protein
MVCKCENGQVVMVPMLSICYISKLIDFDVIILKVTKINVGIN